MSDGAIQSADEGNVLGNHEAKYDARNPIARWLVGGFLKAVCELVEQAAPRTILEVGCGEGRLAHELLARLPAKAAPERYLATDVALDRVSRGLDPRIEFQAASIYELPFAARSFDLVLCCEVLEHLHEPARGLAEVARVADRHVLLSTPWEPTWRILNVARGKYLRDLGNTPGHVQHFSRRALVRLATRELEVTATRTPLPWTVVLGVPRAR
jgi:ubiquinone/menaquinone biosynthesis C-methylase UbiE